MFHRLCVTNTHQSGKSPRTRDWRLQALADTFTIVSTAAEQNGSSLASNVV